MGAGANLQTTIREWGILVMFIVIISIVLLKFKTSNVGGAMCTSSGYGYLNTSSNLCCLGSASTVTNCATINTTTISSTGSLIDTAVTAFSEPKTWVGIVIIVVIAVSLFGLFYKLKTK